MLKLVTFMMNGIPTMEAFIQNTDFARDEQKKPTWSNPEASGLNHVGLLRNRPLGPEPGCLSISRPTISDYSRCGNYQLPRLFKP
jgi:hypothetical protein